MKSIYTCPFCRGSAQESRLSRHGIQRARLNWQVFFEEQQGELVVQGKRPDCNVRDWAAVHAVLHTGSFELKLETGLCVDLDTAKLYVANQLYWCGVSL